MPKLGRLLDARFAAMGAEALRMTPMRLVIAAALTVLAGFSVGWPLALAWGVAVALSEAGTFVVTRRMTPDVTDRPALWRYFGCTLLGVQIWGSFGLILWTGPSLACTV